MIMWTTLSVVFDSNNSTCVDYGPSGFMLDRSIKFCDHKTAGILTLALAVLFRRTKSWFLKYLWHLGTDKGLMIDDGAKSLCFV